MIALLICGGGALLFVTSLVAGVMIVGDRGSLGVTLAVGFASTLLLGVAFLGLWAAVGAIAHADPAHCPPVSVHRTACDPEPPEPPKPSDAPGWYQEVIT